VKESEIQHNILDLCYRHPKVVFANVNTSGKVKVNTRWVTLGFPGLSDITGMLSDGRLLAIEVKTELGQPTKEQIWFVNLVNDNGGKAGIARSVDEALKIIEG